MSDIKQKDECIKQPTEHPETKVLKQKAREMFLKGFSFEGNNDPKDVPKMMFVIHHDKSKQIARPEYFIAFIDQIIDLAIAERDKEIVEMIETIHNRHYLKEHFNPKENKEHCGYRKCEVDIIRELTNTNK